MQAKNASTVEQNVVYHTMEFTQLEKGMTFWYVVPTRMNMESIMLSERTRHERPHLSDYIYMKCPEQQICIQKVDGWFLEPEGWEEWGVTHNRHGDFFLR